MRQLLGFRTSIDLDGLDDMLWYLNREMNTMALLALAIDFSA
jgi:hypothetical protein